MNSRVARIAIVAGESFILFLGCKGLDIFVTANLAEGFDCPAVFPFKNVGGGFALEADQIIGRCHRVSLTYIQGLP